MLYYRSGMRSYHEATAYVDGECVFGGETITIPRQHGPNLTVMATKVGG